MHSETFAQPEPTIEHATRRPTSTGFAPARDLADTYNSLGLLADEARVAFQKARLAGERALAIDQDGDGSCRLALVRFGDDWTGRC
jgi:hypothetical protein